MKSSHLTAEILKSFDERYFDKNSPSGLNQKTFRSYPELVRDIRESFLTASITRVLSAAREGTRVEKWEHPTICKVWDDENTHCTCDASPETYNSALAEVSKRWDSLLDSK